MNNRIPHQRYAMRYIWPSLIYLGVVLLIPLLFSVVASFTKWELMPPSGVKFIGLDNYIKLFQNAEARASAVVTLKYLLFSVSLQMILGFLIAAFLNVDFRGCKFVRVVVLLPMMLSPTIIALAWKLILNYDRGVLNYLLTEILGQGAAQVWLGKDWAFRTLIFVEVWSNTPFVVMMILAGLQAIPTDVMEAAAIDGASRVQRTFRIVIPMMRHIILVALIFRTTFALRDFPLPWVLTAGGPANLTNIFGIELYKQAFKYYHLGYSSALSWILILLTFGFSILYTKITLKKEN